MKKYILKRLMMLIPLLIIISFLSYGLINLSPQDPAEVALRASGVPSPSKELIAMTREELGLNDPFLLRYLNWLKDVVRLDFGQSYVYTESVSDLIITAFLNTLKLAVVAAIVIMLLSVLIGCICAVYENKLVDKVFRTTLFTLTSMPGYWIAILSVWLFSVKLDLLPTSGMDSWKCYILPVMVLSISYIGFYFRLIRNSMIQNVSENYVLYENACGLKQSVIRKHVLRNSLQTAVTGFCMAIPGLLAGTVVIENIFSWPGIGRLCVTAIFNRDFPVIQAYILLLAMSFVIFNLIGDIVNVAINPRLREE